MEHWDQTSILNIPELTRVLAIECKNNIDVAGILASTTTGLKTGSGWQCSSVYADGWNLPGFDDPHNNFADALTFGNNGHAPWGVRPEISTDAEWIWPYTSKVDKAYCRVMLGNYEDVVHISPSLEANLVVASKSHIPDDDDADLPDDPNAVTYCTDEG